MLINVSIFGEGAALAEFFIVSYFTSLAFQIK